MNVEKEKEYSITGLTQNQYNLIILALHSFDYKRGFYPHPDISISVDGQDIESNTDESKQLLEVLLYYK